MIALQENDSKINFEAYTLEPTRIKRFVSTVFQRNK